MTTEKELENEIKNRIDKLNKQCADYDEDYPYRIAFDIIDCLELIKEVNQEARKELIDEIKERVNKICSDDKYGIRIIGVDNLFYELNKLRRIKQNEI